MWGATGARKPRPSERRISIHAPRVGRDHSPQLHCLAREHFNPRAPCGARRHSRRRICHSMSFQSTRPVWGATRRRERLFCASLISIHAPRVGRDLPGWRNALTGRISIHAPRVGRDGRGQVDSDGCSDFNPRAPCGARQYLMVLISQLYPFQSTRPVWGATPRVKQPHLGWNISIHAPRVGRDSTLDPHQSPPAHFNPRAPCGARLHAASPPPRSPPFQSTRPVWGATTSSNPKHHKDGISIHAPRVGRDPCFRLFSNFYKNFNPRAPCGARLHHYYPMIKQARFQSTRPVWGATLPCPADA